MKTLASRIHNLQPSLTVSIDTRAKEMQRKGLDIIALGAGEPDFDTPQDIAEAACRAIAQGKTRYTHPTGIPELKEAVRAKLQRENQLSYDADQIVITSGAKHAVFNALLALINPGDEVLIPSPCWVTYPELVRLLGGIPIMIPTSHESQYRVSAQQVANAATERTKLLILNSPCNPTGAMYSAEDLQKIAAVVVERDLYCLSDEIYEHIAYDVPHVSLAAVSAEMYERTVVINGVSKAYAMTGWRIGYLAAPPEIAHAVAALQSQTTHHPSNISQWASVCALNGSQDSRIRMAREFRQRRDWIVEQLEQIPDLHTHTPAGAFYVFPRVSAYYGRRTPQGDIITGSSSLCSWLLEKHRLAIIPGAAFGEDSCVRLSYAAAEKVLQEAIKRFQRGLAELRA